MSRASRHPIVAITLLVLIIGLASEATPTTTHEAFANHDFSINSTSSDHHTARLKGHSETEICTLEGMPVQCPDGDNIISRAHDESGVSPGSILPN